MKWSPRRVMSNRRTGYPTLYGVTMTAGSVAYVSQNG